VKSFFYFIVFLLAFEFANAQECEITISGHVHSDSTHENLSMATITVLESGKSYQTNSRGDFVIAGLCKQPYTLLVTHVNFDSVTRLIKVKNGLHIDIDLVPSTKLLNNITVKAKRSNESVGFMADLTGKALDQTRGQTLAEALSKLNGVTMLQTGTNINKPVVHGLHSNRILIINNGIRQEGQQWGNEHAPEIDPFIAGSLKVVKGVDELRYGSDAIGGVILVEPKTLRVQPGTNAAIHSLYATNNGLWVLSGSIEHRLKKLSALAIRLQGTLRKGANVQTPDYRINNTALNEHNFSVTATWHREHFNSELFYSQFNTSVGIFTGSHIGNITDLLTAISTNVPNAVFTGDNTYKIGRPRQEVFHQLIKSKTGFEIRHHQFNLILATQFNKRKEFDIVRNPNNQSPQIKLDIATYSGELNWQHPKHNYFTGQAGIVFTHQENSYSGRYLVPNYNLNSFGMYYLEKWSRNKWSAEAGMRFDKRDIATTRLLSNGSTFNNFDFRFSTFAFSAQGGRELNDRLKLFAGLSISSRAPHVNELLTNGLHHGNATYEIGDIALRPERSFYKYIRVEASDKSKTLNARIESYHNYINRYIYQQPKPDDPVLTIQGAFPKIVYQSTDVSMFGVDFSFDATLAKSFIYTYRYSLLRARNMQQKDWMIGMPGDRMQHEIVWNVGTTPKIKEISLGIGAVHVFKQSRFPSDKNGKQDYSNPPMGYSLLQADMQATFYAGGVPLTLAISGRNLLNKSYRDYLDAFRYFSDAQGRNIIVRIKILFESHKKNKK
jgi:iron complex outermembrane recepter protein